MCGIVGYIGKRKAASILLEGIKGLEYRGYDSAGIAVLNDDGPVIKKQAGEVNLLARAVAKCDWAGSLGIAHTRWATHGAPTEINAHPHTDCSGRVFLVHNGIIENYKELKNYLSERGHKFKSETDTEVVAHLIEEFLKGGSNFKTAFLNALKMVNGTYALAVFDAKNPDFLYAARLSSPLVIGVASGEYFLASDVAPLVGLTSKVIYLKDGEIAEISRGGITIINLADQPLPIEIERLEWTLEQAQRGNYPHFMLKEIFEGPEVIETALRGRLKAQESLIKLGGLESVAAKIKNMDRFLILACGTSYYAGLVGEYLLEEIARIPTEVQLASEFRYRDEPLSEKTVALAISQSGETADTLAAIRKAKQKGLLTLGLVNVVGSSIARDTDAGVYNHAGPEIGVASTKAFLSQIAILTLIALYLSRDKNSLHYALMKELEKIPLKISQILQNANFVEELAEKYKKFDNFLFLGRRYNYPVALEGALKLKEVSYIHAEGYGAGEMKHGPIAMINQTFPTVAVVPQNSVSQKMYSNIEEVKARQGPVLAIATEGDTKIATLADDVFYIPPTIEPLEPLLAVVPLHLFAYYIGVKRGYNVDKPRNLAKSVTVE
jgi:glucosamine--fructose-6-phosphate aminotransferase (isomerizing)